LTALTKIAACYAALMNCSARLVAMFQGRSSPIWLVIGDRGQLAAPTRFGADTVAFGSAEESVVTSQCRQIIWCVPQIQIDAFPNNS
jgi:hypothetical protein